MQLVDQQAAPKNITPPERVLFASFDDFRPGPEGGVDLIWSTKKINSPEALKTTLREYDNLLLGQTWVMIDKESSSKLDEEQILEISQQIANEIKIKLGQRFKLVATPTEKTLRLNIALTNIVTPNPILAVTSSLLPVGLGISAISKIVTGEHTNVGKATIELLISDATTNEPLFAAIDTRSGRKDFGTMLDSLDDTKDAISWWVNRLGITLTNWAKI